MNLIQEWLDGPQDYEAGRLLYEQHGRNPILKRTLSHGATAYNRSALREELGKLVRAEVVQAVATAVPVVEMVIAGRAELSAQPTAPTALAAAILADLEKQWKPLYKEASFLQSQLEHAKDNQQRGEMSHRILDLMEEVENHWATAAYVQEHGQLPPTPPPAPTPAALDLTDAAAVLKRRNNLRSQISKQRHNADRAADVAAWEAEKTQLDTLLKMLTDENPV